MAINYTLNIGSLNRKLSVGDLSNVVYEVTVGVNANSVEYPQFTYSCGGTISFDISELDSESFVPFEQIDQDTVIGWLLEKEGVDSVEEFSYVKYSISNIQDRIDALQLEDSVSVSWTVSNASTTEPELVESSSELESVDVLDESVPEDSDEQILEP